MKSSRSLALGLSGWAQVWSLAVLLLGMPALLSAQATSTIQGQVTDSTGAAVVAATVKATNEGTGVSKTVTTAGVGYYRVPDLLPGTYQVRVAPAGIKTSGRSTSVLTPAALARLYFSRASAPCIQTL